MTVILMVTNIIASRLITRLGARRLIVFGLVLAAAGVSSAASHQRRRLLLAVGGTNADGGERHRAGCSDDHQRHSLVCRSVTGRDCIGRSQHGAADGRHARRCDVRLYWCGTPHQSRSYKVCISRSWSHVGAAGFLWCRTLALLSQPGDLRRTQAFTR